MGTTLYRRPPRRQPPPEPRGEIVLESPPELPETVSGGGLGQTLTYLPMLAGAGSTALLVTGSGGSPITYVASGMMALSMAGMAMGSMGRGSGEKRRRLDGDRRDYQRYLAQVRRRVRTVAEQQRASALWHHPDPSALWCVAMGTRLWERRQIDSDYLAVRIGRGPQRLAVQLVTPETKPVEDLEPISAVSLRRFIRTHGQINDLPLAIATNAFGRISVTGDPDARRGLARAMIGQLAAFHTPDDVVVAVCAAPERLGEWEWLKWLPHAMSPDSYDAVGQVRMLSDDLIDIESMFGEMLSGRARFGIEGAAEGPHVFVVLDGGRVPQEAQLANSLVQGVTVLDLGNELGTDQINGVLRLEIDARRDRALAMVRREPDGSDKRSTLGRADSMTLIEAEALARRMTPLRISAAATEAEDALSADLSLPDLLRLGDPYDVDTDVTWRTRAPRDRLRVPIGVGADRAAGRARHQGVGAGRHGPARAGHRRHRFGQVRAAAHARAGARAHPLVRDAELRPRRLQGRCDVRQPGRPAAHVRDHHEPRGRTDPRRPHEGRSARRDGPAAGGAARGRQLLLGEGLRAGS